MTKKIEKTLTAQGERIVMAIQAGLHAMTEERWAEIRQLGRDGDADAEWFAPEFEAAREATEGIQWEFVGWEHAIRGIMRGAGTLGGVDLCVPSITYRADTGIHGEAIVVAECGHASALYIVGEGYSADDSDVCPATKDGCWPDPPASLIDAVATRTYYVVLGPDGNIKRRNRQDNGEYDHQRDAEAYRQSLPDPDYFTVEAWTERRGK